MLTGGRLPPISRSGQLTLQSLQKGSTKDEETLDHGVLHVTRGNRQSLFPLVIDSDRYILLFLGDNG